MKKILFVYAVVLIAIILVVIASGCGSMRKVRAVSAQVSSAETKTADTSAFTSTERKTFGDTLAGSSYVPFLNYRDSIKADVDSMVRFETSSAGIKLKGAFKPIYNNGRIAGLQIDYSAIAKPVTVTNTTQQASASVHATVKKDSTARTESDTTTKMGWSAPWWCWLLAAIISVCLGYWLYKKYSPIKF